MKQLKYLFTMSLLIVISCSDNVLNENAKSFLTEENLYTNTAGFESALNSLYAHVRNERNGEFSFPAMYVGTDLCYSVFSHAGVEPFTSYGGQITSEISIVHNDWDHAYRGISWANKIVEQAENPDVNWNNSDDRDRVSAEAKFFRAYFHWKLTTLFGDVPVADEFYNFPKLDFVRVPQQEVLEFVRDDLMFASENLPTEATRPGKLTRWAAFHLLTTVYLQLDNPVQAEITANEIINSGHFNLMTERFGVRATEPGDVFSDLFIEGNQLRSSGNMESIWVIRQVYGETGGGRDWSRRVFLPFYERTTGLLIADSLGGRGVGRTAPLSSWVESYEPEDIRASKYNIRKQFYYNDPDNLPEGKQLGDPVPMKTDEDPDQNMFMHSRKWEFGAQSRGGSATHLGMDKDRIEYRLAETYLLLAEAQHLQGKNGEAAASINVVRERANASPVTAGEVDMDFILDERGRELFQEVPRRLTLYRTGMFLERVRRLNWQVQDGVRDHHELWPIPQSAIDRNIESEMSQNPGY